MQDNWLHADLHPGNIIVQPHDGPKLPTWLERSADIVLKPLFGATLRQCLRSVTFAIVDVGMVTSMQPKHFRALIDVYSGLTSFDGAMVGDAMTRLRHEASSVDADLDGFKSEVTGIFKGVDAQVMHDQTSEVVTSVLESMRRHRLTLDAAVSVTLITVLTLEGWASKLDPDIRILDAIEGMLPEKPGRRLPQAADLCLRADLMDS
jgi:aarF domain-containing kinase